MRDKQPYDAAGEAPPQDFWIDVGGTFTDCIARPPNGRLRTHKLLSNGVYRGRVGDDSTVSQIIDLQRRGDPPGFFRGFYFRLMDSREPRGGSQVQAQSEVADFYPQQGMIRLKQPLPVQPTPGSVYELRAEAPAPILGIHWLSGKPLHESIGEVRVRLGTTRGTNALLERKGAPTAFVATKGFGDLLLIGDQTRPTLFDLNIRKPEPLNRMTIELDERIDATGRILQALEEGPTRQKLQKALASGIIALAVCLLNSHRNPGHEAMVERIARSIGFEEITISSRVSPLEGALARAETAVVNAYLSPVMRRYFETLRRWLPDASLLFMTSAGGLAEAESFAAKDGILSGPAAGVVGCAATAQTAALPKVIGFDMGGTSTDVSRYEGRFHRRYEMGLEGGVNGGRLRIRAPMLAIETVAAGGGSVCGFDGVKPFVGPTSAGAHPGPACYGHGGPLCVTDVNYYLGRLLQDNFPFPLDRVAVESRLDELRREIKRTTGRQYDREELASGFVDIANERMVAAIRRISTRQGCDPREYALLSFGGAGGQHACAVARSLGMRQALLPARAGALSAYGVGMAAVERFSERSVGAPLGRAALKEIELWKTGQEERLRNELLRAGHREEEIQPGVLTLELRYEGQDSTISIPLPPDQKWRRAFEARHRQLYGFTFRKRRVEIHAARLQVSTRSCNLSPEVSTSIESAANRAGSAKPEEVHTRTQAYFGGRVIATPVLKRERLRPGEQIDGPAIVLDATSTFLIEPDWHGVPLESGDILLTLSEPTDSRRERPRRPRAGERREGALSSRKAEASASQLALKEDTSKRANTCDPITLELFNNRFVEIAQEMGETLQRTALSTNVKDRLDFSCALFDATGGLVANAPHIPVHLGAMGECVKCLLEDVVGDGGRPRFRKGDVFVTNDPYRGGTHLPDVTVITPVFDDTGGQVLFFTASRAHHAEIGGVSPGSMPPGSRNLAEEGVLIRSMRLVESKEKAQSNTRAGGAQAAAIRESRLYEQPLRRLLTRGPYPSRNVATNLADVHAQAAANQCGARLLGELAQQHGLATVRAYMHHIRSAAEQKMRATLRALDPGEYAFVDYLDDQTPIAVKITIVGDSAIVDFTGSGGVHPGNLNATPAIVRSAVLYCFRCLIADDIPLNAGVLAPLQIIVPEGVLNPPVQKDPARCAAVAGGNVETSQRIVDVIFGALRVVAASQGTMNNLSFGNERFGYYETICGGAGAGPDFDGADAVHTHMTNTRLTDPEVLEARYPVRLRRFAIRSRSGGGGRQRGGDGVIREIEFLEPLEVSLLTQRRVRAPYGLADGSDGKPGRNRVTGPSSMKTKSLPPIAEFSASPGDVLTIETPGGGGYGRGPDSSRDAGRVEMRRRRD